MADELEPAVEAAEEVTEEVTEVAAEAAENEVTDTEIASDEAEAAVADTTEDVVEEEATEAVKEPSKFIGDMTFANATKNPAMGLALTVAGVLSFTMGMNTFFQTAMAWTFVIWGLLLLLVSVLNIYQRFDANDDGLAIRNPIRFWSLNKFWEWSTITRIDVMSSRRDTKLDELDMHIYREPAGQMVKEREDVKFNPDMAQVIIERAGLMPVGDGNPSDLESMPLSQKATYHWTKSGSIAA